MIPVTVSIHSGIAACVLQQVGKTEPVKVGWYFCWSSNQHFGKAAKNHLVGVGWKLALTSRTRPVKVDEVDRIVRSEQNVGDSQAAVDTALFVQLVDLSCKIDHLVASNLLVVLNEIVHNNTDSIHRAAIMQHCTGIHICLLGKSKFSI
jgi:hypothetical protein